MDQKNNRVLRIRNLLLKKLSKNKSKRNKDKQKLGVDSKIGSKKEKNK